MFQRGWKSAHRNICCTSISWASELSRELSARPDASQTPPGLTPCGTRPHTNMHSAYIVRKCQYKPNTAKTMRIGQDMGKVCLRHCLQAVCAMCLHNFSSTFQCKLAHLRDISCPSLSSGRNLMILFASCSDLRALSRSVYCMIIHLLDLVQMRWIFRN